MSVQLEQWSFIDSSSIKAYARDKKCSELLLPLSKPFDWSFKGCAILQLKQHDNITIILLVKLPYCSFIHSELMLFILNIL